MLKIGNKEKDWVAGKKLKFSCHNMESMIGFPYYSNLKFEFRNSHPEE